MNTSRVAGLVLAGGRSTRMGGVDKALLPFGEGTMLAAVLAALDLPVVAISANGDPARFAAYGCTVLSDGTFQDQGPLAGILAGLAWAEGLGMTAVLTAPAIRRSCRLGWRICCGRRHAVSLVASGGIIWWRRGR